MSSVHLVKHIALAVSFSCFTCSSSLGGQWCQCHVIPAKHSQVTVDGQEGHFVGGATVDKLRPLFFSVGCVTQDASQIVWQGLGKSLIERASARVCGWTLVCRALLYWRVFACLHGSVFILLYIYIYMYIIDSQKRIGRKHTQFKKACISISEGQQKGIPSKRETGPPPAHTRSSSI